MTHDVGIIYEHPDWHTPLFEALEQASVSYVKIDLKHGAFAENQLPKARLYYNMVSPSANLRGNQRAIPFANAVCKNLEALGHTVLNGSRSIALEMSKSSQIFLLSKLGVDHPRSVVFNNVDALSDLRATLKFPMILKPEQGGSGSRMYLCNSLDEIVDLLNSQPELWLPDNLLILQEKLENDPKFGIVRLEFVGDRLLYAMRVVTHGVFNLCPSVVCNPEDGSAGHCEIPETPQRKPEFYPYHDVPDEAVETGQSIMRAAGHSTGSVEYLETPDGRRVFYDINANSNLRASIGEAFGVMPFDEVAKYLIERAHAAEKSALLTKPVTQ